MQDEKVFAQGFMFKRNEKAPEFVVGRLSIKIEDAVAFMREHDKNGWVNLSVKQGRSGNYYIELDTFEPKKGAGTHDRKSERQAEDPVMEPQVGEDSDEDLPF